jgi:hypothetical protein
MDIPAFDTSAERVALEGELAAVLAELPGLQACYAELKETAENAQYRYELCALRGHAATRRGVDEAGPGLIRLLERERQARTFAAGVAERARRELADGMWRASCLRLDIEQLDRFDHPPPPEHRPEIVKRPKPDLGTYDPIKMPPGAVPAAENAT